jgi:predicted unusual protein kinase regulating ubiquinone biosynthesis (AarF/ABC1/UbiB family)
VRQSRAPRLRRIARRFRGEAVVVGGVLIKLGQFLSARVDVLPVEITEELAGLQDEVPPAPFAAIEATLGQELGDLTPRFAHFEQTPLAAASLGQVYRARLQAESDHPDPSAIASPQSQTVVVKVQRPGIEEIVRIDLDALRVVARWVMRYRPIRRRANVPALLEEFAHTLLSLFGRYYNGTFQLKYNRRFRQKCNSGMVELLENEYPSSQN